MKTIKINKSILLLLSVAILTVSCNDFLDVNENPNSPSISTPSLTLPVAQQEMAQLNGTDMTYLGNMLVVNWATPSNWSANSLFARYSFTATSYDDIFERSYVYMFKNLTYVENYTDPTGAADYSTYKAISQIMKGYQYQLLVDLYGDIPFTEANLRGENTTPKYDDAATVYKSVIDSLTSAANLALNLPDNAEDPGTQDIILGGHMDEWAQFANTIKLRMLVRLSNTNDDAYIASQIASIDANGAGYITADISANPGYTASAEKQSPFYDYFIAESGTQQDRNDFTVASKHTIEYLTSINDDRLSRLYLPAAASGNFKGAEQSTVLPGTGFTNLDLSHVGPGLLKSAEQDQVIMSLAEALFIQAEATERGYITGGDSAQDLYEAAIAASYEFLEVPDASTAAAAYYAQPIANVSWASSPNKIEAIMTQKWIALNGTSSIESWIDLTRTGFPAGLPIPAESDGVRPVRLLYPASEVSRNSDNVPSQTANDIFTQNPFWK
ncbi:SusD/RagB family nutrient-binding outer membrane lipoprotein [Aureibaculum algae]|uniref:SusD/RagB family nutrient-binding outer membrane lipoprotein n=1 Tax=Aureibaculum algae TaxID=2584122 RepID=A0A5B7TXJ3_9FLAO|nr:SusD/RagB family nutrient-binding outer membrane lipoprotein [Aureibaculum algae]QCX40083.1 SusD/RagB family nutrient-binding outer membrane lipoprotein [Aureibaculum algae]